MTTGIEVLQASQDAALTARKHLVIALEEVRMLLEERNVDESTVLHFLESAVRSLDIDVAKREARIIELERNQTTPSGSSRLQMLLRRQGAAREEREALIAARNAIQVEADVAGQHDLTEEQDRRFRALTREIAEVDDEITVRNEEIDKLAALSGMRVDS